MTMKLFATLAAATLAFSAPANAQKFPNRPITMAFHSPRAARPMCLAASSRDA